MIIDVDDSFLALLECMQMLFLRRLLGLHSRSMRAVLFTETGIVPIRYHDVILVLQYLQHLLSILPTVFEDACLLKKPSCVGDISLVLSLLMPCRAEESIPDLIAEAEVEVYCARTVQREVDKSEKDT